MSSIPQKPLASDTPAARGPGRLAGLEVALHLPGPARREREPAGGSRRRAHSFLPDLGERDERLLHPAARQHDLHDERHDDAAEPAARTRQAPSAACPATTAAMVSRTCISRCRPCRRNSSPPGSTATRNTGPTLDAASYADSGQAEHEHGARSPSAAADPDLFQQIVTQKLPPGPGPQTGRPNRSVSPRTEQ